MDYELIEGRDDGSGVGEQVSELDEAPVKLATTGREGRVRFTDAETGEEVTVLTVDPRGEAIAGALVQFIDGSGWEYFAAEDPDADRQSAQAVFAHNSVHTLTMHVAGDPLSVDVPSDGSQKQRAILDFAEHVRVAADAGVDHVEYRGCQTPEQLESRTNLTLFIFSAMGGGFAAISRTIGRATDFVDLLPARPEPDCYDVYFLTPPHPFTTTVRVYFEPETGAENPVYSEDFSNEPGFDVRYSQNTAGVAEVYWDEMEENFFAEVRDQSTEWFSVGLSPVFSTVGPEDGFEVSFRFNPVQPDWGHYPGIYFVKSDAAASARGLGRAFEFTIDWSDHTYKKFRLAAPGAESLLSPTIPAEDEWYEVHVAYDPAGSTMSLEIFREDGSRWLQETDFRLPVGSAFDQVMIGEVQSGTRYGSVARVRIDDIVVRRGGS